MIGSRQIPTHGQPGSQSPGNVPRIETHPHRFEGRLTPASWDRDAADGRQNYATFRFAPFRYHATPPGASHNFVRRQPKRRAQTVCDGNRPLPGQLSRPSNSPRITSRSRNRSFISVAALLVNVRGDDAGRRSNGSVRRIQQPVDQRDGFPPFPLPAITTTLRSKGGGCRFPRRLDPESAIGHCPPETSTIT